MLVSLDVQKLSLMGEMVVDVPCCSPTSLSPLNIYISRPDNTSAPLELEVYISHIQYCAVQYS